MVSKKTTEALDDIFDAEEYEKEEEQPTEKQMITKDEDDDREFDADYDIVRQNYLDMITEGKTALEDILKLARNGESARAFEVANDIIKNLAEINNSFLDVHEKKKKRKTEKAGGNPSLPHGGGSGGSDKENVLLVGKITDILEGIEKKEREINPKK